MSDFETAIQEAVDVQEIPGCVLFASNRDGSFKYSKTFGHTSMVPERAKPLQTNTVMWVASCTKLMTSICALQLVEQGKLTLDDPVYTHIPELKSFKILKTFDNDGKPVEVQHTKPITLRTLLTHTSGLSYDGMHPKLLAWLAYHNRKPTVGAKLLQRFDAPLVFEPGESWMYGASIDYAGLLVERVTGLTLEEYMRQNLWEPLGIKDMTFKLASRPDMKERMADMSGRDEKTGKVELSTERQSFLDIDGQEVQDCMGGQGVFTTPEEYSKVLHAVLTMDEDERFLKKETLKEFFTPQLGEAPSAAFNGMIQSDDMVNNAMGGTQKDSVKNWGLGGLLLLQDQADGKAAGTMIWGGLPNLIWWVDPKTGLCGLYATQVVPTGDAKCAALNRKFEVAMYEKYQQSGLENPRL
ncbi:hypothetical protein E8E13_003874 [Curvularia kusanoi]|uniref:Beta-lactamase-related domain-containing protein n=1 Tax=Curvularia kusanoi TaxID=90978 RepID=A0A9P4TAV1_CURKU|nr:hypothetical protein E8E13_003874 [Curvularia kusanoi]